jgi:ATP sulfurylase
MGCSHFIVGRDHTGVGDFYSRDANRELFDVLGDIGVKPVFFETVGYNSKTDRYEVDRGQPLSMISGSKVRETLRAEKHLPDWFMRDLVQDVLLAEMESGKPLFYE